MDDACEARKPYRLHADHAWVIRSTPASFKHALPPIVLYRVWLAMYVPLSSTASFTSHEGLVYNDMVISK
jgi:hypothetical protein